MALVRNTNIEGGVIAIENMPIDEFGREIIDECETLTETAYDTLFEQEEERPKECLGGDNDYKSESDTHVLLIGKKIKKVCSSKRVRTRPFKLNL